MADLPVPTTALQRLQLERSRYSFAAADPPPSFVQRYTSADVLSHRLYAQGLASDVGPGSHSSLGMSRRVELPPYNPLNDPALANYFARKFEWNSTRSVGAGSGSRRSASASLTRTRQPVRGASAHGHTKSRTKSSHRKGHASLEIFTSKRSNPVSKSEKYITVVGTKGRSDAIQLAAPGVHFRAGNKDVFQVNLTGIGKPTKVILENTGTKRTDGWCVSKVVLVKKTDKGTRRYRFSGPVWLSKHHDEMKLKRVLHIDDEDIGSGNGYRIDCYTGDVANAGTDAVATIQLFGSKGQSPMVELRRSDGQAFQRARVATFTLDDLANLGKLKKLVISHNGHGMASGWFLDKIIVTSLSSNKATVFPCDAWLDRKNGRSKELVARTAAAGAEGMTTFTIRVMTGDRRGAGTDANVQCTLFGEDGESGPHTLNTSRNDFRRGHTDVFAVSSRKIGTLKRLRIWHDNGGAGPAWFLDAVEVVDEASGQTYRFECNRWLAKDEDDGQISRELTCNGDSSWGLKSYKLTIFTGDKRNAGTSANVFCKLVGERGASDNVILENSSKNFQRDRTDIFTVEASDLGSLRHIVLGHDNHGMGAGWYVERFSLEVPSEGKLYNVDVKQWFATDMSDGAIERTFRLDNAETLDIAQRLDWKCTIYTSDVANAGTDANVFMQVYGKKGKTDVVPLKNKSDTFERGQTDELRVQLINVGSLRKLRVWHDNKGMASGWHLDRIVLSRDGEEYIFPCAEWLAVSEGDKEIVRELPATGPNVKKPLQLVEYTVRVATGHARFAGTNADVFVMLTGELGDSGKRALLRSQTNRNKFERGKEDVFTVAAVDLGKLTSVTVGHNNAGTSAGWFLDKIVVLDPRRGEEEEFPCHRWLAVDADDGQIERELVPKMAEHQAAATTTYIVKIKTGDVRHAGTDANVFVQLFGKTGESTQLKLRNSETYSDAFERNKMDIFKFELLDLGDLSRILVGHDNKGMGAAWFLDYVEVEVPSIRTRWKFPCSRWFSKSQDDGLTEREIYAEKEAGEPMEEDVSAPYLFRFYTSDVAFAGTDANVSVVLYGDEGKTEELVVNNQSDNFERGKADDFKLACKPVGRPSKIRLSAHGGGMSADWHLEKIEVHELGQARIYTFEHNDWLRKGTKAKPFMVELPLRRIETVDDNGREVVEELALDANKRTYRVKVHTGDQKGAGTDANVYVNLHGSLGDSGDRHLKNSLTHTNKFQRKTVDEFDIDAVTLGDINKVKVWHDNAGLGAAWYLEKIEVVDTADDKTYIFPCAQWFAKSMGDGQIARELGVLEEQKPADFQTKNVGFKYRISVHTSDVKHAGTDANVDIVLYGEKGDTGKIRLAKSETHRDMWERGNCDVFTVSAIELGDLKRVDIMHDGKGVGSGWHLNKVVVDAPQAGKTWTFMCDAWLDKATDDGTMAKTLYASADAIEEYSAHVPYEIIIKTSDVRNAGTDANVFIDLYGRDQEERDLTAHHEFKDAVKAHFERNLEDRFNVELPDVGSIYKIRLGHDGKGMSSSWHVASVVVINQRTHERFEFPCDAWLSKDKDDKKLVREFAVGEVKALEGDKVVRRESILSLQEAIYKIHVFTGDIKHAGTDANIYVQIFGDTGDSGEIKLEKSETYRDKFERGHEDIFTHRCLDLGPLRKIKVRSDGKGLMGGDWYLDRVEVHQENDLSEPPVRFVCQDWFKRGKQEGDTLEREITAQVDAAVAMKEATALEDEAARLQRKATTLSRKSTKGSPLRKGTGTTETNAELEEAQRQANIARRKADEAKERAGLAGADDTQLEYKVTVYTGTDTQAGTTANVWLQLFGEKDAPLTPAPPSPSKLSRSGSLFGRRRRASSDAQSVSSSLSAGASGPRETSTGRLQLNNAPADLQSGAKTTFTVTGLDVGELVGLEIGHDDERDKWYLEQVVVEVPKSATHAARRYEFKAGVWLAARADGSTSGSAKGKSKASVRLQPSEIHAGSERILEYTLKVYTASADGAGCTAVPQVQLFGDKHTTEALPLRAGGDILPASVVETQHRVPDLGALLKVRLMVPRGSSWTVEKVEFGRAGQTPITFVGSDGSAVTLGAERLSFDFLPAAAPASSGGKGKRRGSTTSSVAVAQQTSYRVYVTTADERGTGTDANVSIILYGAMGDSGEHSLTKSETFDDPFERGNTDVFTLEVPDLGELQRARIWHDGKGMFSSWKLDKIVVVVEATQSRYELPCGQWLSKNKGDKQLTRDLAVASKRVNALTGTYKLEVATDSRAGGGCKGPVRIMLLDAEKNQLPLTLEPPGGEFAPGSVEHLVFDNVMLLGPLTELRIRRKPSGASSRRGAEDDDEDDNEASGASSQSGSAVSPWHLEHIIVKHLQSGQSFVFKGPSKGLSRSRAKLSVHTEATTEEAVAQATKASVAQYEVAVTTGTERGAGTDSNVFVTLFGKNGDSGERALAKSKTFRNMFESGNTDVFDVECQDLGELTKIEVKSDLKGFGAAWQLDKIKVTRTGSQNSWQFKCDQWFDKKQGAEHTFSVAS
ncbi:uncharacterized protein MONBRDRAFT_31037 [Monosiga brevicollis MX1]|uniref:PLAT domain-containing protein n=1 Tax=Monosiga brevicollis TaxID=81824 RepID=A9UQV6_MONBE|nr:uncharacterized protein MONBRDRAFT_31037 [Monosiga brevicollis MX1]EDQ93112.1 predicted protein [Monosiga brevicollis MX1]|eukprot:XP_001742874.1 hypothetical protein [Monosiga brevicollis MX1]